MRVKIDFLAADYIESQVSLGRHVMQLLLRDYLIILLQVEIEVIVAIDEVYLIEHEGYDGEPRKHIPVARIDREADIDEFIICPHCQREEPEKVYQVAYLIVCLIAEYASCLASLIEATRFETAVAANRQMVATQVYHQHCHKAHRIHQQRWDIGIIEE